MEYMKEGDKIRFTTRYGQYGHTLQRTQGYIDGIVDKILIPSGFHPFAGDPNHGYYDVKVWIPGPHAASYQESFLIPVSTQPDENGVYHV